MLTVMQGFSLGFTLGLSPGPAAGLRSGAEWGLRGTLGWILASGLAENPTKAAAPPLAGASGQVLSGNLGSREHAGETAAWMRRVLPARKPSAQRFWPLRRRSARTRKKPTEALVETGNLHVPHPSVS